MTGQPFFSSVDVKAIAYFHAHEPFLVEEEATANVRWLDSASLATVPFAYDHIPEVLRKCGMTI